MEDKLKIKVTIGDRVYPLTIQREEEERVRQAVQIIQSSLERFQNKYAVQDRQDALAMCSLQIANQMLGLKNAQQGQTGGELDEDMIGRLRSLETQLEAVLGSQPKD